MREPPPPADPLMDLAEEQGTVVVIAQLAVPQDSQGLWNTKKIARAQRKLVDGLGPGARVLERFERMVPQIMLRLTPEALEELRQSPLVVNISLNEADEALD